MDQAKQFINFGLILRLGGVVLLLAGQAALFIAWRRQFGLTNREKEQERLEESDAALGGAASG
jgi:hypothetical protein